MTATQHNQITLTKGNVRWLDVFIWLYIAVLIFFSVFYAQERIIAYDTAGYMIDIIRSENGFYIATNRYISTLAQILPVAGIMAGVSLKALIVLYSLNFTLISVTCALVSRYWLKDAAAALAILLFYTIMNGRLFYYPVSEFQMGLSLLLLYHALFLFWIKNNSKLPIIFFASFLLIVTITFSHPLSVVVLFAWIVYMLSFSETRNWKLVIPAIIGVSTHFIKEKFFRASVGTFDYEQTRRNNIDRFNNPISTYFDSPLAKDSWKEYTGQYFIVFVLILVVLIALFNRKKWLGLIVFPSIIFAFWLLVTVSFGDSAYTFYHEHIYQPVCFFIALGFGYALVTANFPTSVKVLILATTALFSFAKINAGYKHNHSKIEFYKPYIDYMRARNIKKAALPRQYLPGNFDSYWAGHCEAMLVSGLQGADSAIVLYLHYSPQTLTEPDEDRGYDDARYIRILKEQLPVLFDSIATPLQIDSLNRISKHNPDN